MSTRTQFHPPALTVMQRISILMHECLLKQVMHNHAHLNHAHFNHDNLRGVGGFQPKKPNATANFKFGTGFFRFFSVFFGFFRFFSVFSVFPFWPILTGLTGSC